MSSHNERIAATRQQACADFAQITSTNPTTARHYLRRAAFDLERAVSLFYEAGGSPLPSDDEGPPDPPPPREGAADGASDADDDGGDPVSALLDAVRGEAPAGGGAFRGREFSLNAPSGPAADDEAPPPALRVRVTFYKDGFTDEEEPAEGGGTRDAAVVPRRRGVHSFSSSSSARRRLPPKRSYDGDGDARFIKDVRESRVPAEYRRVDARNRPVPVSIVLVDHRKRDYPADAWDAQRREERAAPRHFAGAGQALGGWRARGPPSPPAGDAGTAAGSDQDYSLTRLVALLLSLWSALCAVVARWVRQVTARPLVEHAVDPRKATTTLSLRLPDRPRARVDFNADHTVEDLRRYCRLELGGAADEDLELLAGFPPKAVGPEKNSETLEGAGLLNSAVDVRLLSNSKDKRQN